jgi:hypothetical protein
MEDEVVKRKCELKKTSLLQLNIHGNTKKTKDSLKESGKKACIFPKGK